MTSSQISNIFPIARRGQVIRQSLVFYSGDLNNRLDGISNGGKLPSIQMVGAIQIEDTQMSVIQMVSLFESPVLKSPPELFIFNCGHLHLLSPKKSPIIFR